MNNTWYDICNDYSLEENHLVIRLEDDTKAQCDCFGGLIFSDENDEPYLYFGKAGLQGCFIIWDE